MKLLVIAYPVQPIIFRVYDENIEFNEKPQMEFVAWHSEFYDKINTIKRYFQINKIYIYGQKNYYERITNILEDAFENVEIERIKND